MGEDSLQTSDRQHKKSNEPLAIINEKRSPFKLTLVRGYGAEKLGRSEGKEVARKASGGKAGAESGTHI